MLEYRTRWMKRLSKRGRSPDEAAGQVAEAQRAGQRPGQAGRPGPGHRRAGHRSGRTGAEQAQDTVGGLADQAQGVVGQAGSDQVGQVADQAQDVASQMAGSLPEGYEALGKPFTDDQGNTILQGQDEEGNTVIVRRGTDDVGNTVDSIFDAQGNLLDENIVEEAAEEEGEEPEDVASQMAGSLPEGYEALGKPFTDDQGNTILQGQDEEGNTVIVRRATDEEGNTIDSIFSAQGELLDEEVVEEPAEDEEPVDEATQMAESMPEGYTLMGEPTTDEEGRTVLTGEDEQGRHRDHPARDRRRGQRRRPGLRLGRQPAGRENRRKSRSSWAPRPRRPDPPSRRTAPKTLRGRTAIRRRSRRKRARTAYWAEAFSDWTSSRPPRAPRPPWSPATPRITTRRHQSRHHREVRPSRQRKPSREKKPSRKAEEGLSIRCKTPWAA